jgi:hypothetical protein
MSYDNSEFDLRGEWRPPPEPAQPPSPAEVPDDTPPTQPPGEPLGVPTPPPEQVPFEPDLAARAQRSGQSVNAGT